MVSTLYMTIATYMVHHALCSDLGIFLCCFKIKWHKKVYTDRQTDILLTERKSIQTYLS